LTPAIAERLIETLRTGPVPLARLQAHAREAGSTWSADQLRLFLECLDGVALEPGDVGEPVARLGERSARDELAEAILEIVRTLAPRPIPPQEVLRLLPAKFTTSVEQIKAIARTTPGLELFGPGLLRPRP
jgi:hypothetical protein